MEGGLKNSEIGRREVLKASGVMTASGLLNTASVTTVSASNEQYHLGRVQFVETAIEHPDSPSYPTMVRDGRTPYVIDNANERLALVTGSGESFERNVGVAAAAWGRLHAVPGIVTDQHERKHLTKSTDYRRLRVETLSLEESYTLPRVELEGTFDDGVRATVESRQLSVEKGEETRVELTPRSVRIRRQSERYQTVQNPRGRGPATLKKPIPGPVETVEVTPVVRIRNHGRLDVYGGPDVRIYPLTTDDPYTRRRVHSVRSMLSDRVTSNGANDLLVVHQGGEQ